LEQAFLQVLQFSSVSGIIPPVVYILSHLPPTLYRVILTIYIVVKQNTLYEDGGEKFRIRRPFSLIKKVDILEWIHGTSKNKIPGKASTHFLKCILVGPRPPFSFLPSEHTR
jgi:hypothetical protein